jgi:hypothetical protein
MLSFAEHLAVTAGPQLEELIHTPLGARQIKNGSPFTYTGRVAADHYDHVHVADTAPGSVLGGARGTSTGGTITTPFQVQARRSGLPGVTGALADRATAAIAGGLNRRLAAAGGVVPGTGGGGTNRQIGRRMMLAAGWGSDQWGPLDSLWTGESNWSESVVNAASGATGIPQALPGSKMASAGSDWRTNPETQIAWGLGYIKDRYGSPSAAYSAWLGRSPHWYGKGGSGIYRKGALIGVGDSQPSGGSEHVSVRRLRPGQPVNETSTTGGVHVTINLGGVHVGSQSEARRFADDLGERVAKKITDALREAPMAAVGA